MVTRRRSTRALNNDAAIRTAAIELILRDGIDSISFRDVGRVAGLTHGALYARFEDVEELLVDLWDEVLCHRAVNLLEAAMLATAQPTKANVRALFNSVRVSSMSDAAMVQVLLSSRRFPILREEVETFIHDRLESIADDVTSEERSRSLVLFALVMVQILQSSLFGPSVDDVDFLESVMLAALKIAPESISPIALGEPTDRIIPLPSNDLRSQLAYQTFHAVGKSGYARSTISRISRRANCSPGNIYKLYPSKEDLVIAATRKIMQAPWITISMLANVLEEGVLTQLLFSASSPQNEVRKSFTLEIAMASAHSEKIRAAVETQMQGLELLVPLLDGISEEGKGQLRSMIRAIISVTLGSSFFSTVTTASQDIDFNQFAEPFRRAILDRANLPWSEIKFQLEQMAISLSSSTPKTNGRVSEERLDAQR